MKTIEELKNAILLVTNKIQRLEGKTYYSDQVAKSFHLGMVGGSGRNVKKLNERRSRDLDKTIDNAVILCELYKERGTLEKQIEFIESGGPEKKAQAAENRNKLLAEYWQALKPGDKVDIGGNSPVTIIKKSKKSIQTQSGCKWSAGEIIGRHAANLL